MLFKSILVLALGYFLYKDYEIKLIKFFLLFNLTFIVIIGFRIYYITNEIYLYVGIYMVIILSNKKTIYIVFFIIFMKNDNLLINLIAWEGINLILIFQCKNAFRRLKNTLIPDYIIITLYTLPAMLYFYFNYGTLDRLVLLYFDQDNVWLFLAGYLFIKMGGLFARETNFFLHKNLSETDFYLYLTINYYLHFYIFHCEEIFFPLPTHYPAMALISMLLIFAVFLHNFKRAKSAEEVVFFFGQLFVNTLYLYQYL